MKIACVLHRYGADIGGGSEKHGRDFAMRLAERGHQVTVLTSCATDYITWANALPAGDSQDGPLRVRRFPVAAPRDPVVFAEWSRRVFPGTASAEDERRWFELNGPYMPTLLDYLRANGRDYDVFLFFSFRYAHAFFGLPLVADRAVLVPTAEEDPAIGLKVLRDYFALPRAMVFNTHEERAMLAEICRGPLPPGEVTGCGVDPVAADDLATDVAALGVREPFVLYLGRVDPNKGCAEMVRHHRRFVADTGRPVQLVLAGNAVMPLPRHEAILPLGFVSDAVREALLYRARCLVMPSPYESLSLVLLESWNHGRPVLVNGRCRVLQGQTRRCNGGLFYESAREYRACLEWLLDHERDAAILGRQGYAYVEAEYRWPTVMARLERTLAMAVATTASTPCA